MRVRGWRVGLLPYAMASAAVLLVSSLALTATLQSPAPEQLGAPPAATSVPRQSLSDTGRLAYWRPGASGKLELWVGDLDGARRWPVATASAGVEVTLTRWSPDGDRVAYSQGGTALGIARVAGGATFIDIPASLRSEHWKIVSFEWSPDGAHVAATLRASNGIGTESDVYVVETRAGALWKRATTMGEAYAGAWIDAGRLFVETTTGMIAVLDLSTGDIRPLTGMPAASPLIGRDGRVYFVGGQGIPSLGAAPLPYASGWVWSATIDGDDVRREEKAPHDQMRLLGMLADGRAVVGVPGSVYVAGGDLVPLPYRAGNVRRVVVSQDGRRIVALADPRIVQIDASKIPERLADGAAPATATSVLLDGVRASDAWLPSKPVELEHAALAATTRAPLARLAYVLGGSAWEARPGVAPRPIVSTRTMFGYVGLIAWSPAGDGFAAVIQTPGPPSGTQTLVVQRSGEWRRAVGGRFQRLAWSPDGTQLAATVSPWGGPFDVTEVQVYDAEGGTPGERIVGATAAWTPLGMVLLTNGTLASPRGSRTGQRIELLARSERRLLTDAERLSAEPLVVALGSADLPAAITRVVPSADGRLLAVWIHHVTSTGGVADGGLAVIRADDGVPLWVTSFGPTPIPVDLAWSPTSTRLLWSIFPSSGMPSASSTARVVDGLTGRTLLEREGQAAGWSPDGAWVYIARDEGLSAVAVDGSAEARISSIGVPVVATKP